ncbi:hypothetical protein [Teredinibacter sp. KSP-S5-2]|uniref:hypothetical protein n=1 Tax=Teredinibacter sp. KSP-S5-2 TaxID=3034506 RepID=UPI0029342545|nr:hypothetical protein [Teredinibacter sp. KSP-S5-2]WNO11664.1 hypothetical protein P5V12_10820 [Teredinibacter sp. KSP-S5-2]
MRSTINLAIAIVVGFFASNALALCYSIPIGVNSIGANFEVYSDSCPSVGGTWKEVCVANEGSSYYLYCKTTYGTNIQNLRLPNPYGRYTYRAQYRKSDGSTGVIMYGSVQGYLYYSGGGSSSSSSSGGAECPPDMPCN